MTAKVSVLMAVHNGEKYLRQAVESILKQTYSDFEFVIVDDGSGDNTVAILDEYAARDSRMVLARNDVNMGLARSLNRGLDLARGDYIARMDADDVNLPGRFAAQISFLEDHPDIGLVGTAAYFIDSRDSVGQLVQYPQSHDLLCWIMCFFENPVIHPSVMARRKIIKDLGGYDEACSTSQDYDLWSRMAARTKLANIQEAYLYLRKHEESISHTRHQMQQEFSLGISASLISRILNTGVQPVQIRRYCDFIWRHTGMSGNEILFAAGIIFRLAKKFLSDRHVDCQDRLWIFDNAIGRLNRFNQELSPSLITRMRLGYWKWSLKHLV
jgi:glycosyltransferase involved in cell wall biosynthesis